MPFRRLAAVIACGLFGPLPSPGAVEDVPFADCREVAVAVDGLGDQIPVAADGLFRIRAGAVYEGLTNVVIDLKGATRLYHGEVTPFVFRACSNIVFRNVTIDFPVPSVVGCVVQAMDPAARTVDFSVAGPAAPFPYRVDGQGVLRGEDQGASLVPTDGVFFDASGHPVPIDASVGGKVARQALLTRVEANPYDVGVFRIHVPDTRPFVVGTQYAVRTHGSLLPGDGVLFMDCDAVRVENVTVCSSFGDGFVFQRCNDVALKGVRVERSRLYPGRRATVKNIGFYFAGCSGTIDVDNCLVEGCLGHAVRLHHHFRPLRAAESASAVVARRDDFGLEWARPGDEVRFLDAWTLLPLEPLGVKVTQITNLDRDWMRVRLDRPVPDLMSDGRPAEGLVIENLSRMPSRVAFHGCVFRDGQRMGLDLAGGGSVLVEDSSFEHFCWAGLAFRTYVYGDYAVGHATNVVVRGNRFVECCLEPDVLDESRGMVFVWPAVRRRQTGTWFYSNVSITDNTFATDAPEASTLWAEDVKGLRFTGNAMSFRVLRARPEEFRRPAELLTVRDCEGTVIE